MGRQEDVIFDESGSTLKPNYSQHFVVPSKTKSAINIVAPSTSLKQAQREEYVLLPPRDESAEQSFSKASASPPSAEAEKRREPASERLLTESRNASIPEKDQIQRLYRVSNGRNGNERHTFPSIGSPQSLDIFAPSYVPLWLRAVNESVATISKSLPLNSIDLLGYLRSFAGYGFVQPHAPIELPPIVPTTNDLRGSKLSVENYDSYFRASLQNEIAAQASELRALGLYNVPLHFENLQQHSFRLSVPGIRENTPLIDLGDIVMVRPLSNVLEALVTKDVRNWYDSGGKNARMIAPGFEGVEYHAVVCGISKPKEQVLLRINGSPHFSRKCNVIFVVQEHRCTPLFRSLRATVSGLRRVSSTVSSWLRSMLFPDSIDGKIQFKLPQGTFDIKWFNEKLNYEQRKAVNAIVKGQYGNVPYLISGPPGTGKTSTIVESTLQILQRDQMESIHLLVCSPSPSSADTLASRLATHLTPKELFRLNSWTRSFAEVPENLLPYCFIHDDLFSLPDFKTMMSYKVVVCTCRDADLLLQAQLTNQSLRNLLVGVVSALRPSMGSECGYHLHWRGLLLDEAAQATEPEALIPMAVVDPGWSPSSDGVNILPFVAMAGDEFQLGPRLSLKKDNPLQMSLFERLFRLPFYADHPLSRANGNKPLKASMLPILRPAFTNLVRNYRSHPAILTVPSTLFYHDTLLPERTISSEVVRTWPGWKGFTGWPVLFKQNNNADDVESLLAGNGTGAGGLFNEGEAHLALETVESLLRHSQTRFSTATLLPQEIVVMSPFRAQVKLLRTTFRAASLSQVNIGPLESFQGLEGRVVIICTTRTRLGPRDQKSRFVREDQSRSLGLIDEAKRFNVAITRAKEGLIVIGDSQCLTCTNDHAWKTFLAFCQRNGCVEGKIWEGDVDACEEVVGRLEKAMKYAATQKENVTPRVGFGSPDSGRRRLKGAILSSDEMMWQKGMEVAELSLEDDEITQYEETEDQAEGEKPSLPNDDVSTRTTNLVDVSITTEPVQVSQPNVEKFDRDLAEEFEKADCATQ